MPIPAKLRCQKPGLPPFTLLELDLVQALSELYELRLVAESEDPAIDPATLLGESVELELPNEPYLPEVTGLVRSFAALSTEPTGMSRYELLVAPPLWLLARSRRRRIVREADALGVFSAVLVDYGSLVSIGTPAITHPLHEREYTVQHDETDLDFVRRVLADAGVSFFFDHDHASRVALADDPSSLAGPGPVLPFRAPGGAAEHDEVPHVRAARRTSVLGFGAVLVRDYDWEAPFQPPTAIGVTEGKPAVGRIDEHAVGAVPARTPHAPEGRAAQLLQELRAEQDVVVLETSFAASPGWSLRLEGHPTLDGTELFVVRARSRCASYEKGETARHELVCIPRRKKYRPPRLEKPRIHGTQSAFVVGAPGEEIDVDAHGRVEVAFRWDLREPTSTGYTRRVRVSQPWAGAGYGLTCIPRVGEEVLVGFVEGDPDEPMIVGRVHSGVTPDPLMLPGEKTQSVWRTRSSPGGAGYSELRFEDRAGKELVGIHAAKDMQVIVEDLHDVKIGRHATSHVGGNQKGHTKGSFVHRVSGGNMDLIVGGGTFRVTASDGIDLLTPGSRADTTGASHVIIAKKIVASASDILLSTKAASVSMHEARIVAEVPGANVVLETGKVAIASGGSSIVVEGGKIVITVGAASIELTPGNIKAVAPLIDLNP